MSDTMKELTEMQSARMRGSVTFPIQLDGEVSDWLTEMKAKTGMSKSRMVALLLRKAMTDDRRGKKSYERENPAPVDEGELG